MSGYRNRFEGAPHPWLYNLSYTATYRYFEWRGGINITGAANLERTGPSVYAANHEHLYDFLIVGLALARAMKVPGKKELKGWQYGFLPGLLLEQLGGELFDREGSARTALERTTNIVCEGYPALSFIEKTRKNRPEDFKPEMGAAWIAIAAAARLEEDIPLHAVGLSTAELERDKPIQMVVGETIWIPKEVADWSPPKRKKLRREITPEIGQRVAVLRDQSIQMHREGAGVAGKIRWND